MLFNYFFIRMKMSFSVPETQNPFSLWKPFELDIQVCLNAYLFLFNNVDLLHGIITGCNLTLVKFHRIQWHTGDQIQTLRVNERFKKVLFVTALSSCQLLGYSLAGKGLLC